MPNSVANLLIEGGTEALVALPDVGRGIARVIEDIVLHGGSRLLDRLREGDDPERLFRTLPGIGPRLAQRLHRELGLDTLEDLETACHEGRLSSYKGFGPSKIESLQAVLEKRLGRPRRTVADGPRPEVGLLLAIDRLYRDGAAKGRFRRVAPRRFNPDREVWLPIAHFNQDGWHFTALFSNTARAHHLGKTRDWVVLYYYDHHHQEGSCTVVTEHRGPMKGRRVVRGREDECLALFEGEPGNSASGVAPGRDPT